MIFRGPFDMKHLLQTSRLLVFIFLLVGFSSKTPILANEKDFYPDVCSPQTPDCYFERFSKLKLPRVEPIQASEISVLYKKFLYLKPLKYSYHKTNP